MAKLIIIRGNSGGGKTTLANELQRKFGRNTWVISQDIVRREMLWVKDRIVNEAVDLMINLLQYTAKAYMRIITISLLKKRWLDTLRNFDENIGERRHLMAIWGAVFKSRLHGILVIRIERRIGIYGGNER